MAEGPALESLLAKIGTLAATDRATAQKEVSQFNALSFFEPGEVISTTILSYLLNANAPHGQQYVFLGAFVKALGINLGGDKIKCASVQTEAQCFTQNSRRKIDLLILFSAGDKDYAVVVESKSHGAQDQDGQVRDYLEHLCKEYPRRDKFLFYLKDGGRPNCISILPDQWEKAHTDGICHAGDYRKIMGKWLSESLKCTNAPKLVHFLEDFAAFSWQEDNVKEARNSATKAKIDDIIHRTAEYSKVSSEDPNEFEALLAIYELHDHIWDRAVRLFMERVRDILQAQLPAWVIEGDFEDGNSCLDLVLSPAGADPEKIQVCLETEWDAKAEKGKRPCKPMNFVFFVRNGNGLLPLTPKKGDHWRREWPLGVTDIRSAEGLRALLTEQAAQEISTKFRNFATENWERIANCPHIQ